jgi:DNA-binding CsgD family transcriptional regulator
MADFVGRRHVANMGFICLGLSMPLLSLLPLSGIPGYLIAQTLIQGGYACIDVFLWVSLADIASEDRVSTYYGIGLGLNVWLIFFGILFVERFLPIGEVGFSNISLVATLILFFGVIGLVRLEETLTYEGATVQGIGTAAAIHKDRPTTEDFGASRALSSTTGLSSRKKSSHQVEAVIDHYVLNLMAAEYSLTRRELEVVVLLLKGMTNDEIEERLCISEGTLKTHIRHVFQKLDISNRKELLVSFTRFLASSEEADRKTDLH